MKVFISLFFIALIIVCSDTVTFGQNYKIKQSISMSGHNMTSTVYVKGSRKRTESGGMMGMGGDVATLEQCDLGRTVQVSDKKKLYYVMEDGGATAATKSSSPVRGTTPTTKPTKGGTITHTTSINDTGERKQMFGLTARHIKTTITMTSSPDACNRSDMTMEIDGWYVDLPLFSCPVSAPSNPYTGGQSVKGCQDTFVTKSTGSGKLGFPLEMTQTMRSGSGGTSFTQTVSTVEFSKATLDDALFNVPADYRLASSSQDLYGRPDYAKMASGEGAPSIVSGAAGSDLVTGGKKPGMVRIGVLAPTTRSNEPLSTVALQSYLVRQLSGGKVEAVAVASEADAKAAECDYVLTSDFSKLKQSAAGKVGGLFGSVTGAPTAGKYDTQVDYKLVPLTEGKAALQSKAAGKTETEAQRAAEAVLAIEARAVVEKVRQN